jgi:hypothetical protein
VELRSTKVRGSGSGAITRCRTRRPATLPIEGRVGMILRSAHHASHSFFRSPHWGRCETISFSRNSLFPSPHWGEGADPRLDRGEAGEGGLTSQVGSPSPDFLRKSTSPHRGEVKSKSVLATHPLRPSFAKLRSRVGKGATRRAHVFSSLKSVGFAALSPPYKAFPVDEAGKRSAERRIVLPIAAPQTSLRSLRNSSASRGCALPSNNAPAFRRSRLRHSPPATTPMAQLQNRVSRGGR